MNNLDKQYLDLLKDILENGIKKEDRTGTGTISVFSREIKHNMSDGFPLLTTKKMAWKTMITELLWFLKGDTNIKYLIDNNCNIWNGDAYKNYKKTDISNINFNNREDNFKIDGLEFNSGYPNYVHYTKEEFIEKIKTDDNFSKKWGELGPIYGSQWRKWMNNKQVYDNHSDIVDEYTVEYIDQIKELIYNLKNNPDSRRLMVNSWNVGEIENMVLPPCHYGFQCYSVKMNKHERYMKWNVYAKNNSLDITGMSTEQSMKHYNFPKRKLSLKWNQRSCDFPLGIPMNISSYGLLLEILSKIVNMIPDELIGTLGDCHIYVDQIYGVNEQLNREPMKLPTIKFSNNIDFTSIDSFLDTCTKDNITLNNYNYHPKIQFPLSN
jgi:thymidylate synthase